MKYLKDSKNLIPLCIGVQGFCFSSYLLYDNMRKQKWEKVNGTIDNVTLKYSERFLQGAYYIIVEYYFQINNQIIRNHRKYKIGVHFLKNKIPLLGNNTHHANSDNGISKENTIIEQKNLYDMKRDYVQNLFDQISAEKNIEVAYNSKNSKESEPLIYIFENEAISKNSVFRKIKQKFLSLKKSFMKHSENSNITIVENSNDMEGKEEKKKKLLSSHDINNLFPLYMFLGSSFLILSFFFKKRIYNVRKQISQHKQKTSIGITT